jgi:pyruvate kinase
MLLNARRTALEEGLVEMSDTMVLAAGMPIESAQPLNTIRVYTVGNILARGTVGAGEKVTGRIFRAESLDDAAAVMRNTGGEVLVVPSISKDYIPILRLVNAVIAEGGSMLSANELRMVNPNLVWIAGVEKVHGGTAALESGLSVTVDGKALLVYEGIV